MGNLYLNDSRTQVVNKIAVTSNSRKNNIRPYLIQTEDANSGPKVLWLNGDYSYWMVRDSFPEGFTTAVMTDFDFPAIDKTKYAKEAASYDFSSSGGKIVEDMVGTYDAVLTGNAKAAEGVLTLSGKNDAMEVGTELFRAAGMDSFTVSFWANIYESNYAAGHDFDLLRLADQELVLSVKDLASADSLVGVPGNVKQTSGRLPVLEGRGREGNTSLKSTNMLSNSDWHKNSTGTNGAKNVTNMGWTHFAVTYDAGTGMARMYVNGLVDINGTLSKNLLSSIDGTKTLRVGGFEGEIKDVKIFPKALDNTAVKKEGKERKFMVSDMELQGKKVTAYFEDWQEEDAFLVVSVYDAEGVLVEKRTSDIRSESVEITLSTDLTDKKIKAFVWRKSDLMPLSKAWVLQ